MQPSQNRWFIAKANYYTLSNDYTIISQLKFLNLWRSLSFSLGLWSSRWAPAALPSGLHLLLQSDGGDAGPPEREGLPQSCGREQPVPSDYFHPEAPQVWWWDSEACTVTNHVWWEHFLVLKLVKKHSSSWSPSGCIWGKKLHSASSPRLTLPVYRVSAAEWQLIKNLFRIAARTVPLRWSDIWAAKLTLEA